MTNFQSTFEFLDDFVLHAQEAKHFIRMQAMVFEFGHAMDLIFPVLANAVSRGVRVEVNVDWVSTRYVHGKIRLVPNFNRKKRIYENSIHNQNRRVFKKFSDAGIIINVLNTPDIFSMILPVLGRNHIKMYIVDDVSWVGGVNFFDRGFTVSDFMVRFDDLSISKILHEQFLMINESRRKENFLVKCSESFTFVNDCGLVGNSLIYKTAMDVVSEAKKEVVFVSQMVPEGRMLDLLIRKAKMGIKVVVITSSKNSSVFVNYPYKITYDWFLKSINGIDKIKFIHAKGKVHAKLLIVDTQLAMFGSHNFVESGIWLGTEEIAIKTTEKALIGDLVKFVEGISGEV